MRNVGSPARYLGAFMPWRLDPQASVQPEYHTPMGPNALRFGIGFDFDAAIRRLLV
jgi:hypothetical protein